jgi:hypothetical protein
MTAGSFRFVRPDHDQQASSTSAKALMRDPTVTFLPFTASGSCKVLRLHLYRTCKSHGTNFGTGLGMH